MGKREHLLAYEVDRRHVAARDLVLTPKPAPLVCSGQQKAQYEYHCLATSPGECCFWTTFSSHSPSVQLAEHSWGENQKSWVASQGEHVQMIDFEKQGQTARNQCGKISQGGSLSFCRTFRDRVLYVCHVTALQGTMSWGERGGL